MCDHTFTLKHRLQVGHWNLNGSMSKQFGSKLESDAVLKIIERCHIFGINETHLLPSNGKQLAGYKDFHSFRKKWEKIKNYNSGGLSVYIRDEISDGVSVIHSETPDYISVEMDKNFFQLEENIYTGFLYIASVNSSINDCERTAYESLEKDISKTLIVEYPPGLISL